jgi:hypothetical protein
VAHNFLMGGFHNQPIRLVCSWLLFSFLSFFFFFLVLLGLGSESHTC